MATSARCRVVVTGIGVVSSCGWGRDALWDGLCSGETRVGPFRRFPSEGFRTLLAAEVPEPDPAGAPDRRKRLSNSDRFAVAASREAFESSGLKLGVGDLAAGVFFGASTGGMLEGESFYSRLRRTGHAPVGQVAAHPVSSPGEAVARALRLGGTVQTISSACVSGTLAIAAALDAVRCGEVDLAVAGGADALCRLTFGGFNALRAVDERPSRPFRRDRAGMSLGEGAAALVLEPLESALARGAAPIVEVCGAGASSDAHHMTAPDPQGGGAARAIRAALDDAGLAAAAVDFVNAHGTGTPLNDVAEWRALSTVFGERAGSIPLTSTKAGVGHLLGAAGAIEAAATILCLERRSIHPTPGDGEIDAETPVNLVRDRRPAASAAEIAVSVNLGFGGCNAALVFERWRGDRSCRAAS